MSDPIVLKIAQSVVNICLKILSAWKDNADKREKAEWQKQIDSLQATKSMNRMVGENLSRSLHTLNLPASTTELLAGVDKDFIFHCEAARLLSTGELTSKRMVELLKASCASFDTISEGQLVSMAALWIESIQLYIAKTPELCGALQLKLAAQVIESQDYIRQNTADILTDTALIRRSQEELTANVSRLLNLVQQRDDDDAKSRSSVISQSIIQQQFQSRFDRCREGLISGSIPEATSQFASLIEDLRSAGELGSRDLLFRSLLNYSSCLLHLERLEEASSALDASEKMFPMDPRFFRHKAMLLANLGRAEDALDSIRHLRLSEPDNIQNIINEMSLLQQLGRDSELAELLATNDSRDLDFRYQKAYALLHLKKLDEAKKVAKQALDETPDNEAALLVFAYANAFPIIEGHQIGARSVAVIEREQLDALNISIDAALKAYAIVQKRGRLSLVGELQGNILAFYFFARRDGDALKFAAQIPFSESLSDITLNNLFALFVRRDCASDAVRVADVMLAKLPSVENRLKKAYALSMAQRGGLALEELGAIRLLDEQVVNDPKWVVQVARAHLDQHQSDKAIEVLGGYLGRFPSCVEVKLELADHLDEMGRDEEALSCYEQAQALEPDNFLVGADYATFLTRTGRWNDGLKQLKKIGADSTLSPLFSKYLICAYNAKNVAHCLELVEVWMRENSGFHETIYSIGARCAFGVRELSSAKKYLEALVGVRGKYDADHRRMLAQVYLNLGDLEEAYTLLKRVVIDNDPEAKALSLLGTICSAQQKHKEALESHMRSLQLDPSCVDLRSAFFGSMLLLPEGFSLTVEQLKAHHENIAVLSSHPGGVLRSVRVLNDDGTPDLSEMQKVLASREKAVKEELHDDTRSPRPLAILASNLGLSLYDAWATFSSGQDRGIRMCHGSLDAQREQYLAAEVGGNVTVDLVALLSLQCLGQLNLLSGLFSHVHVHVSTLDSVVNDLRNARLFPGKGSIASVSGQLIYTETNPGQIQRKISALSEILDFIKGATVSIEGVRHNVSYADLIHLEQPNRVLEVLMEPALLARERRTSMLSDDLIFRLFSARLDVPVFCTQSVLRLALDKSLLRKDEYQRCVLKLFEMDYSFVSYDADTLKYLVLADIEGAESIFLRILKSIVRPGGASLSVARVFAEFLAWSWLQVGSSWRDQWARKIWNTVYNAQNPEQGFVAHFVGWLSVCMLGAPTWFTELILFAFRELDVGDARKARMIRFARAFASAHGRGATVLRVGSLCHQWRNQSRELKNFQETSCIPSPTKNRRIK